MFMFKNNKVSIGHQGIHNEEYYSSLFRRQIIRLMLTYLVPFIILAFYFLLQYRTLLHDSRNIHLRSVAENHANLLDLYLRERMFTLVNIIDDPLFPDSPVSEHMKTLLETLKLDSETFIDIGFFDSSGVQIAYSGPYPDLENMDYSKRKWYSELKDSEKDYIISDLHLGYRNEPHFTIALKRIQSNQNIVFRATLDPGKFYEYISSLAGTEEVSAYIVNKEGYYQVVASQGIESTRNSSIIPPVNPEVGIQDVVLNGTAETYAYSWLNMAEWALILRWTDRTRTTSVFSALTNISAISSFFIVLIITVIIIRGRKLVRLEKETDQTKAQLEHAEKMSSIGQLAAGVAHEINNPLTGVLTSGHILLKKTTATDSNREDLEIIVNETTRCREIIKSLLDFARQTPPNKEMASLNDLIDQTLSVLNSELLKSNITVERDINNSIPKIFIDVNQIKQVFLNLILNAIEAMSGGGSITISTDFDKQFVYASIKDTGSGIQDQHISKIFEPFFTTKSSQKGTGLGLSVSYGIIQKHYGWINVKSIVDKGTTFIIKLLIDKRKI